MIDAEKQAFEYAAKLAKEYREHYKSARNMAIIEFAIIAVLIVWGCLRG